MNSCEASSALLVEAMAVLEGFKFANQRGLQHIIVESD